MARCLALSQFLAFASLRCKSRDPANCANLFSPAQNGFFVVRCSFPKAKKVLSCIFESASRGDPSSLRPKSWHHPMFRPRFTSMQSKVEGEGGLTRLSVSKPRRYASIICAVVCQLFCCCYRLIHAGRFRYLNSGSNYENLKALEGGELRVWSKKCFLQCWSHVKKQF